MEAKNIEPIHQNTWQNNPCGGGQWLEKFTNPSKKFFLQLVANTIEDVNILIDFANMCYTRKIMIRCGLALTINSFWTTNELFPHLQEIIAKH